MFIQAVTLDCAGTLVEANWDPPRFVARCARDIGCPIDRFDGEAAYGRLLQARSKRFLEVNLERSQRASDRFWWELAEDWCDEMGVARDIVPALTKTAEERLFGVHSEVFRVYADTLPSLEAFRNLGLRMAVVSNWDTTLHRVLAMFGIDSYLQFAIASLEEGVEKPDPRLFGVALERFGLQAERVLHVGDHPIDDYDGARGAGMQAVLLDRTSPSSQPYRIQSLSELPEVLASIG